MCLSIWSGHVIKGPGSWASSPQRPWGCSSAFPVGRILLLLQFFGPRVPGPDASHGLHPVTSDFPGVPGLFHKVEDGSTLNPINAGSSQAAGGAYSEAVKSHSGLGWSLDTVPVWLGHRASGQLSKSRALSR